MKIARFARKAAELCLVFLFSFLFPLGPGSTARASTLPASSHDKMNAVATGFHVSGRSLLDANGNNFVMRGINYPYTWYPWQNSSFQNIKAKGANTIRVVLSSGQTWPKNSAGEVTDVIALCKTNKLVCMLEVHDTTGYGQQQGAASLAQAVDYWKEIKSVLVGQEAYVIINIGNEPYGNPDPTGYKDPSFWVDDTKNAIAAMRSAGFQHMLVVDAPNWGQDWQYYMRDNAAGIFNSDPLRNTVFSVHMYGVFNTPQKVSDYILSFVNAGLPLIIGEFGHFHTDGDPDEDTLLSVAQTNGIGYLAWSWSGNSDQVKYLDLVTDFDPNQETWWGNRLIRGVNGICRTSVEASIYGGDRDPMACSITRVDPSPTSPGSVKFTVLFNEAVTGVDTTDFRLVRTGRAGAAITGISGTGLTRTVTVSTGPGKRTIHLEVVDNDSIKDGTNHPLGGTGAGNGNHTSWERYNVVIGGDTAGVFRPINGLLYLKNRNTTGIADMALNYGLPGDYPVVGDWDGNDTATIGIYRNGYFYLRNSNTIGFAEVVFPFGQPGDQPIAGDWNGDGVDTIGVFRPSNGQFLLRNSNTEGPAEMSFYLGNAGDVGIAGDWDGDGVDTTGVFRPNNGLLYLKNTNQTGFADLALNYGLPGDRPVTGDWENDGVDTIGIYRNGTFYLRKSNTIGFAEIVFGLGNPGDIPIAGNWDGIP